MLCLSAFCFDIVAINLLQYKIFIIIKNTLLQKKKKIVAIIYCNKFFVMIGYCNSNFCCNKVPLETYCKIFFVTIGYCNSFFFYACLYFIFKYLIFKCFIRIWHTSSLFSRLKPIAHGL